MRVLRPYAAAAVGFATLVSLFAVCSLVAAICFAGVRASAAPPKPRSFGWPLTGIPAVVVPFNPPAQPWLPGQRGVDLASRAGAQVLAAGDGTVAFAGVVAGVGVVSVDHADGLRTTYEPVRAGVRRGQHVTVGMIIGVLEAGAPRCPAGVAACLHWGLRRGDVYLDPLLLLGYGPVRLLPLANI